MIRKTDSDDPSTWSDNASLVKGLIDDLDDGASYSMSGAWLVRKRAHDSAYIVYKAQRVVTDD